MKHQPLILGTALAIALFSFELNSVSASEKAITSHWTRRRLYPLTRQSPGSRRRKPSSSQWKPYRKIKSERKAAQGLGCV